MSVRYNTCICNSFTEQTVIWHLPNLSPTSPEFIIIFSTVDRNLKELPKMSEQTHPSVLTDLCLDYSWITNNMIKAVIKVGVICDLSAALMGVTINSYELQRCQSRKLRSHRSGADGFRRNKVNWCDIANIYVFIGPWISNLVELVSMLVRMSFENTIIV